MAAIESTNSTPLLCLQKPLLPWLIRPPRMGPAAREESYRHRRGLITQRTWQRNYFKQVLNPLRVFFLFGFFSFFFFFIWWVGCRGCLPASQSNIANYHVFAWPCCETQQRWGEISKYFFSKPYNTYIKHSRMLDQVSCPVHSTAPQNSHGSTTKQVLASDGRNYLQLSCHWRFHIIEWWSVPAANPLGTKMLPPAKSSHGYRKHNVKVLCGRLCSSQEIWGCKVCFCIGAFGKATWDNLRELAGPHPFWSRRNAAESTCPTYTWQKYH